MTKGFLATVLLLGLPFFAGCPDVEMPPQTDRKVTAGSHEQMPEPNHVPVQAQSQGTPAEPNEIKSQSTEVWDDPAAAETDESPPDVASGRTPPGDAKAVQNALVDEPNLSDVNEPRTREMPELKPAEPVPVDGAKVPEPNGVAPVAAEPNDTPRPTGKLSALAPFYPEYADLLEKYAREDGLVDYAPLNRRRLELKALLMRLDELDPNGYPQWPQDEKLAFWINAYNLKMLEIVTRNYPIQSSWWLRLTWPPGDIRHIKGIWSDYKFMVMDEEFTLAEVERRFFRKTFDDPRVYLAITYAARSGPSLRRKPYRGEGLDAQLNEQVRKFLSSPQGLQIDRRNMVVRLSALFKPAWRGKEFVGRYGTDKKFKDRDPETRAALNFITNYLSREDVYFLEVENYAIEYINFDWRLNDTSPSY
jgi:hypothetical protein